VCCCHPGTSFGGWPRHWPLTRWYQFSHDFPLIPVSSFPYLLLPISSPSFYSSLFLQTSISVIISCSSPSSLSLPISRHLLPSLLLPIAHHVPFSSTDFSPGLPFSSLPQLPEAGTEKMLDLDTVVIVKMMRSDDGKFFPDLLRMHYPVLSLGLRTLSCYELSCQGCLKEAGV